MFNNLIFNPGANRARKPVARLFEPLPFVRGKGDQEEQMKPDLRLFFEREEARKRNLRRVETDPVKNSKFKRGDLVIVARKIEVWSDGHEPFYGHEFVGKVCVVFECVRMFCETAVSLEGIPWYVPSRALERAI